MSLLSNLHTDSTVNAETDSVGGSFGALESGLYLCTITMAYLAKSKGGAVGLNLTLKTAADQEVKQTLWIASGDAKGNKNYYENKQGEKSYLPGFQHANSIALLTTGKELPTLDTEEKLVKIYSFEAKAEVPTKVEVIMDLLDQEVIIGLQKQCVDKNAKGDDGKYHPTGETREENEVDKIFRAADKLTTAEIRAEATEPTFYATWDKKWTGKTRDRSTGASANNGTSGAPKAAGISTKPATSLFG